MLDAMEKGQAQTGLVFLICLALFIFVLIFGVASLVIAVCAWQKKLKFIGCLHLNWMCLGFAAMIFLLLTPIL